MEEPVVQDNLFKVIRILLEYLLTKLLQCLID